MEAVEAKRKTECFLLGSQRGVGTEAVEANHWDASLKACPKRDSGPSKAETASVANS